jgi:hypothetical protein
MHNNTKKKWITTVRRFMTVNAITRKKWLIRMQDLAGDLLKDVTKFTLCSLVLASMFDNMNHGWVTYAGFFTIAGVCFAAAAFFTRNKNDK